MTNQTNECACKCHHITDIPVTCWCKCTAPKDSATPQEEWQARQEAGEVPFEKPQENGWEKECPHNQTFLVTLPGGKAVERCSACNDIMVVSRRKPPIHEGECCARTESRVRDAMVDTIEEMGEEIMRLKMNIALLKDVVRGMKRTPDVKLRDSAIADMAYNSALSDVEEKWKAL